MLKLIFRATLVVLYGTVAFWGCSTKPVLIMPETKPSIVRVYKHITIHGTTTKMVNTGIFIPAGARYSVFAEGKIKTSQSKVSKGPSALLMTKIGNGIHSRTFITPTMSSGIFKASESGYLHMGVSDGGFDANGRAIFPTRYQNNRGSFSIDIILWSRDNLLEIENFFSQLETTNPLSNLLEDLKFETSGAKCVEAVRICNQDISDLSKNEAENGYRKAIIYCPGYSKSYDLLGSLYFNTGEYDKAFEILSQAADLGTLNPATFFMLSKIAFENGDQNLAFDYVNSALDKKADFPEAIAFKVRLDKGGDVDGPKIVLLEPPMQRGIKLVHKSQDLSVRGTAMDKSGIAWVKVNGAVAAIDEAGNFLRNIAIDAGQNSIVVQASDFKGNLSEVSVSVTGQAYQLPKLTRINSTSEMKLLYRKSFAVVIGINNYHTWPALEFAVADARAIEQKFKQNRFDEVTTLIDSEATRSQILTELYHELPRKVGRDDRVVFYFAGHGQTETLADGGQKGYIIPVDADNANYATTSISMDQIRNLSRRISAKHILFVMDSCYSGLGLNRSSGFSPGISDYLRKVSSMRAVQIITAGGKGEQVQEKEGHGMFTSYFLKALDGDADINKDNVVSTTELGAYLRPIVSNASNQAQTPLYGRLEGEGEFLFFIRNSD